LIVYIYAMKISSNYFIVNFKETIKRSSVRYIDSWPATSPKTQFVTHQIDLYE
jgi:hypothetical protein